MFPEGTRTVGAPVNAFKPGITLIAQLAQVPIQTVIIESDLALPHQGLAAAEGAAGAGAYPPRGSAGASLPRPIIAPCCAASRSTSPRSCAGERSAALTASTSHLVVIPSYNTGALVYATVRAARAAWAPVWVVVDGSNDGTADGPARAGRRRPGPARRRAAAQLGQGRRRAARARGRAGGRLHARPDDGRRRPASGRPDPGVHGGVVARGPSAMVLGRPVFDASAPLLRVRGRQHLELAGPTSRRSAPASTIRSTAFASIRSRRWSR